MKNVLNQINGVIKCNEPITFMVPLAHYWFIKCLMIVRLVT